MELLLLLGVVSVSFTGFTKGAGVLPDGPLNAAVGDVMNFTTTVTPTVVPFFSVSWKFGEKNVFYFNVKNETGPEFEGRITVFMSTGTLQLRNLSLHDTGEYRLIITPFGADLLEGTTILNVHVPVSNVMLNVSGTDLVEFNSSVRLSCSSSGSSLTFLWLNSSSEVVASDKVQLTDGNSTLTIVNVSRYDQGPFRCHVTNPVSSGTSDPVTLSISFGPENITLASSSQEYCEEGSDVVLSCSAVSKPAAQFYWFVNGDKLSDTGLELNLLNVRLNQSGNYSCQAFNEKTGRYGDAKPLPLTVLEMISDASVTASTNLTIEESAVNLTCEAAGSVFNRMWMKDGSELILSDSMMFYNGKRILSFSRLNRIDSGEYSCIISNPVSSEGAKYFMVVNYGPEKVQISGPSQIYLDETLTLSCSAESRPFASFTWRLNGTEIHDSSVFTKSISDISDGGIYTCQAMNNVTQKTSTAEHRLTVTVIPSKTSGCSAGCIAGIVISCIVVLCAIAVGLLIYQRNRKVQKGSSGAPATITGAEGNDNSTYSGSQELNYADINFLRKNDGATDQREPQNSSEYAEVRVNNNPPPASAPPTYDAHLQRMRSGAPQPDASGTELHAQVSKK